MGFHTFFGDGQTHLFWFESQNLGAGHGSQLAPKVFGGQLQTLFTASHYVLGEGQTHFPP